MMVEELMTWDKLATFSGLVMTTSVITSFLKEIFKRVPTQIVSWAIAFILLALANVVTAGALMPWHGWILALVNSISISLAANGLFSAASRISKVKSKEETKYVLPLKK